MPDEPLSADAWVTRINGEYAMLLTGGQPVILREVAENGRPRDLQFLSLAGFRAWFSNRHVPVGKKSIPLHQFWMEHAARRQYDDLTFAPNPHPDDHRYNLWQGFAFEPSPLGDCFKFLEHLFRVVCDANEERYRWLLNWLAHLVQRPGEKPGTAVALRGNQGTGKSIVGQVVGKLLGSHYTLAEDPRYLTGRFNSHLASCLLLQLDEATWGGDHTAAGKLKGLITDPVQLIEYKGREPIAMPNFVRVLVTSNAQHVIPAGLDERRFAFFDVNEGHLGDAAYFRAIFAQLEDDGNIGYEHLLYFLLNEPLDVALVRCIPKTQGLYEQAVRSLPAEDQWWLDIVADGLLPDDRDGEGAAECKALYNDYRKSLRDRGLQRALSQEGFGHALRRLAPQCRRRQRRRGVRRPWMYEFPSLSVCRAEISRRWPGLVVTGDGADEWQADLPEPKTGGRDDSSARYDGT